MTVKKILEACSLSTQYVDKIKSPQKSSSTPFNHVNNSGSGNATTNASSTYYDETSSAFESEQEIKEKIHRAKMEKTLKYIAQIIFQEQEIKICLLFSVKGLAVSKS